MLSLAAAQTLEAEHGISVEVVDLRSIRPLDEATILESVKKTGRALLVEENKPYCGVDAQISHIIQLKAFDYLDAPVHRVSAIDAPQIYAKPLEDWQIPNEERIIERALQLMA
jgi:pyruvate dehydrogenase E1 component beta subunit